MRVELIVADHHDRWDRQDQCMEQLDIEELHESMQGALNEAVNQLVKGNNAIRDSIESLRKEVVQLKKKLENSQSFEKSLQNIRLRLMRCRHKK